MIIVVRFNRVRPLPAQVLELHVQDPPGDAEQEGGLGLVAAGVLHDAGQHEPVQLPVDLRVQVAGVGAKPLAEERLCVEVSPRGWRRRASRLRSRQGHGPTGRPGARLLAPASSRLAPPGPHLVRLGARPGRRAGRCTGMADDAALTGRRGSRRGPRPGHPRRVVGGGTSGLGAPLVRRGRPAPACGLPRVSFCRTEHRLVSARRSAPPPQEPHFRQSASD
jgi:hypothetical protein